MEQAVGSSCQAQASTDALLTPFLDVDESSLPLTSRPSHHEWNLLYYGVLQGGKGVGHEEREGEYRGWEGKGRESENREERGEKLKGLGERKGKGGHIQEGCKGDGIVKGAKGEEETSAGSEEGCREGREERKGLLDGKRTAQEQRRGVEGREGPRTNPLRRRGRKLMLGRQ